MKRTGKKFTRLLSRIMAGALATSLCVGLGACGKTTRKETDDVNPDYEFVFRGSALYGDGKMYNVSITGNKGQNTFDVTVEGVPALELGGTYTYVENAGYKLYFEDSYSSQAFSRYDKESKTFALNYILSLGESTGSRMISFSYKNIAFADVYDGVGVKESAPLFTGICYTGKDSQVTLDSRVVCYENGSCKVFTDFDGCPVRDGTWNYIADEDKYHFVLEDEDENVFGGYLGYDVAYTYWDGRVENWNIGDKGDENGRIDYTEFDAVYNRYTDTYSMIVEAACWGYTERLVTYSPDN